MQLTRTAVAHKLVAYLHHKIPLDGLVAWANAAMMEDDFEAAYYDDIRYAEHVSVWLMYRPLG
jgi:hypothetical protein